MKPKHHLLTIVIFTLTLASFAQNPIATLQHAGTTRVFYGQNSFVEAYNASVNGDTINLSVGGFTPPASIAKGLTITGAGHFPDDASVKIRTAIAGTISISVGSDSLKLEGLYINGSICFTGNSNTIDNVKIFRCRFDCAFPAAGSYTKMNKLTFDECFIERFISLHNGFESCNNLLIKHCIINNVVEFSHGTIAINPVIDGNIFLYRPNPDNQGFPIYWVHGVLIKNNIFLVPNLEIDITSTNMIFYNNVFVSTNLSYGTDGYGSNNYVGISQSEIFVNQIGNTLNYTHDYHLKHPELYIGTDGTQVGLYGGLTPFKDGGIPSNPQIISKSVATETDASGNLNINFTVKAQEN